MPELESLTAFRALLPAGKPRVFSADRNEPGADNPGADLTWLSGHGCVTEAVDPARDLRLLTLPRESYDGIWCARAMPRHSIDDCQRVLQIFFQGLKPRQGILFLSVLKAAEGGALPEAEASALHAYPMNGFYSLLRQNGFQLLQSAERSEAGRTWLATISRRV